MSSRHAIAGVTGRALYDSNGRVALEVTVIDQDGRTARALAPRGSSVGDFEPLQLEDGTRQPSPEAAAPALDVVRAKVAPALRGADARKQHEIDRLLDDLDPATSRRSVGGNVTIATSMAAALLGAQQREAPLHEHLRSLCQDDTPVTPPLLPAFNIIDGGLSPRSAVPHIEFLIFPQPHVPLHHAVTTGIRVRDTVRQSCYHSGYEGADSQQGAISVPLPSCEEGLQLILDALAEHDAVDDFRLGLDMAASDVWQDGTYRYGWSSRPLSAGELHKIYLTWIRSYRVGYLEDGFASSRSGEFAALTAAAGADAVIAGDDLYASNTQRITLGAAEEWSNGAVIKPNQAGTVTATLEAAEASRHAGFTLLVSQRSGENNSSFITSLATAVGAHYLKLGGPSRMDRIAKLNELLRISPIPAGVA
jgi:enolase